MSVLEMEKEIRALIAKVAKVEPEGIAHDTDLFNDLGIDSLEGLKLIATVEKRYGVMIPDHQLPTLSTLGAILEEIARQMDRTEAP